MKILVLVFSLLISLNAWASAVDISCQGLLSNPVTNQFESVVLSPISSDPFFWTGEIGAVAFSADFYQYDARGTVTLFIMDQQKDFSTISEEIFRKSFSDRVEVVNLRMIDGYIQGDSINYEVRCFRAVK